MEALELECPGQATDIDNEKRLTDMVGEGEEGGRRPLSPTMPHPTPGPHLWAELFPALAGQL